MILIKIYKSALSPLFVYLFGHQCRHLPTCSEYTHDAIKKYGMLKGIALGIKRIISCNPFVSAKYDPVK